MIQNYDYKIHFGQYRGLSIKDIYQGSLHCDQIFLEDFLHYIFNISEDEYSFFLLKEFIDEFEIKDNKIRIIGGIDDPEKLLSDGNRIVFGNIQEKIESFINIHFDKSFLGILEDIRKFNKNQERPVKIGADPEYLEWCEKNVAGFQIHVNVKRELEKLPIARLKGIKILFIGNETYEYAPFYEIEKFTFKN